jgi:hypothetical protein
MRILITIRLSMNQTPSAIPGDSGEEGRIRGFAPMSLSIRQDHVVHWDSPNARGTYYNAGLRKVKRPVFREL